jgi:hypothetical protein
MSVFSLKSSIWTNLERCQMALMLKSGNVTASLDLERSFDVNAELKKHCWKPNMVAIEAEQVLKDQKPLTYLLRPSELGRGFAISFVQRNGFVKHDYFTLLDPKLGMWRNGHGSHSGVLDKVIRDMMDCEITEGQSLK